MKKGQYEIPVVFRHFQAVTSQNRIFLFKLTSGSIIFNLILVDGK